MGTLSVLSGGLLTTIQDLGRPGHSRIGVSAAGAADALSLAIAIRLAGYPDNTPALEMTILGGTFLFETAAHVAIAGADMRPTLEGPGSRVRDAPAFVTFEVPAGERLRFGPAPAGVRAYLAVHGGFAVPRVLGSASTHVASRLGGLEGRALRQGDRLRFADAPAPPPTRRLDAAERGPLAPRASLRVTDGAQSARFAETSRRLLFESQYVVSGDSDRMGLRLSGPVVPPPLAGRMATAGMPLGAVQIPPAGEPVVLFVDHQTTGGYPVIASVISADLHRLGQLRPRDAVRFEPVSLATARDLLREQDAWLSAALPARA